VKVQDHFTITVDSRPSEGDTLRGGNIDIRDEDD